MKCKSTIVCLALIFLFCTAGLYPYKASAQCDPKGKDLVSGELSKRDAGSQILPKNASQGWYNEAVAKIQEREYYIHSLQTPGFFGAGNHPQHLGYTFSEKGYSISNFNDDASDKGLWNMKFQLEGIGRAGSLRRGSVERIAQKGDKGLQYDYAGYSISYDNEKEGMEQRFVIDSKPAGNRDLQIAINLEGSLEARLDGKDQLLLYTAGHPLDIKLAYDHFKVWDRNGKVLPAHMRLIGGRHLTLMVDDRQAAYPITVDPLNHTPNWTTAETSGLLGVTTSILYGYSVCGNVDLNHDGTPDIVIGAPTYLTISSVSAGGIATTAAGAVGAAFVFYGHAGSVSTTPDQVIQSTAVTGALFGFSVASAGDVNGDGFNDLVIGAPGDNPIILGLLGTVPVGAAYVYTAATAGINVLPTAALTVTLSPLDFASVLPLGMSRPFFGWSVSGAGDVNGDGLADIMVGSPYFYGTTALNGRVDVYESAPLMPITSVTPTRVSIKSNTASALFGFSLTHGDFNGDGVSDIAVGSPESLALVGHAYVFYGHNPGGITAVTPGGSDVDLQAPAVPNFGNAGSAFGFSVSASPDLNGDSKADLIVGAPLAKDELVLAGTAVAAGAAYVYFSSPTGFASAPNITLKSPRSPSVTGSLLQNLLFGYSVAGVGDVNADGHNDIMVGEPGSAALGSGTIYGTLSISNAGSSVTLNGAVYGYQGIAASPFLNTATPWSLSQTSVPGAPDFLGAVVASLGDVNNDGIPDFIVTAPSAVLDLGFDLPGFSTATALGLIATGSNSGSAYGFFGSATILPVTLLNFSGSAVDGSVVLNWSTSMEENSGHFEIERSSDNNTFNNIGSVAAQGNSSTQTIYGFTDKSPVNGANYYRLKMVDKDGKFTYSRVVVTNLSNNGPSLIGAYPSPARGSFNLVFKNMQPGQYRMSIINTIGQQLMTKDIQLGSTTSYSEVIPLTGMAQGSYWVRVVDQQKHTFLSRIVVQ